MHCCSCNIAAFFFVVYHQEHKGGFYDSQSSILEANLRIDSYGQSANLERAVSHFRTIARPNVYSWTILLQAYAVNGHLEGAQATFERMPEWNVVSWTAMLQAHAQHGHLSDARRIFDSMLERNVVSWNSMISAYAKLSYLKDAEDLFVRMPERSVASWNILLSAYSQSRVLVDKARALFDAMAGVRDIISWNTMIFAYVRNHGFLDKAKSLFDQMPARNLVTYTCLLDGFAKARYLEEAKLVFDAMPMESVETDEITYSALVKACSHAGLVAEARCYLHLMQEQGVTPRLEHLCCMVDVTARSGFLSIAEELVHSLPVLQDSPVAWATLLAAYKSHGRVRGAKYCAERGFELDPRDSSHQILLASIYCQ
ncbi:hypothetical protein SELMODRAFT_117107 [Selaginella moellendorffii]|uniref:Pentacotripeptide-repeat region of PRORP domain-containing protein n=1 Tax=Selaginella moellendorffii TaxID=88036 RepID=D8SHC5_SELML|nr:hypothetical protein SELMODRAFT_117107 [Selaginella moellendorffii]